MNRTHIHGCHHGNLKKLAKFNHIRELGNVATTFGNGVHFVSTTSNKKAMITIIVENMFLFRQRETGREMNRVEERAEVKT